MGEPGADLELAVGGEPVVDEGEGTAWDRVA